MTVACTFIRRLLVSLTITSALAILSAQAQETSTAKTFRSIIQNQMQAFQKGDAASAFSFANSSLQRQFQTPDIFIEMVKRGYAPVYRPQAVTFG